MTPSSIDQKLQRYPNSVEMPWQRNKNGSYAMHHMLWANTYFLPHAATNGNRTNLPHDGVLVKARLEDTIAGAGAAAELKGDELHVITQLLDRVAALTGVMLLLLRLLTLLLQISNTTHYTILHTAPHLFNWIT